MIRPVGTVLAFLSAVFFPWPFTLGITLLMSLVEPLVPLSIGLFVDTLYYVPDGHPPVFMLLGALITLTAFFVRARLKTSIID